MKLKTSRLVLELKTPEQIQQMVDEAPPELRAHFSPDWLREALNAPEASPWIHGFRILKSSDSSEIGSGGFKAPPSREGMVELAYGIEPEEQGSGYATEAAEALTEYALSEDSVRKVWAHTLPEKNASGSILTKIGFQRLGEVEDPEDGLVWRWELIR